MTAPDFDAAIVGYGPVGATLANLLALCGLKTLVLERENSIYHLPRAVSAENGSIAFSTSSSTT